MSQCELLEEALDNLRYFLDEYVPHPGSDNLSLMNIRLMDLDRLLLNAKIALDKTCYRLHPPRGDMALMAQPVKPQTPQAVNVDDLLARIGL